MLKVNLYLNDEFCAELEAEITPGEFHYQGAKPLGNGGPAVPVTRHPDQVKVKLTPELAAVLNQPGPRPSISVDIEGKRHPLYAVKVSGNIMAGLLDPT